MRATIIYSGEKNDFHYIGYAVNSERVEMLKNLSRLEYPLDSIYEVKVDVENIDDKIFINHSDNYIYGLNEINIITSNKPKSKFYTKLDGFDKAQTKTYSCYRVMEDEVLFDGEYEFPVNIIQERVYLWNDWEDKFTCNIALESSKLKNEKLDKSLVLNSIKSRNKLSENEINLLLKSMLKEGVNIEVLHH